jgi:hypothetical protein
MEFELVIEFRVCLSIEQQQPVIGPAGIVMTCRYTNGVLFPISRTKK